MKIGHDSSGCDPADAGAGLPITLPRLPIFRSTADALALVEHEGDLFYLAADQLQAWISDLLTEAMDQYMRHPNPAARFMQTGQAWRSFQQGLGRVCDEDFLQMMKYLGRYAMHENSVCTQLRVALLMVFREHDFTGDFIAPRDVLATEPPSPKTLRLLRRSAERMCDWLDGTVHNATHGLWFSHPALFDPDPEKRGCANDALMDREAATMDEAAVVRPYFQPKTESPSHSPPQTSIPPATVLDDERPWPFPILDQTVISLWPLVKLHDWSFADLWNVLNRGGVPLAPTPAPDPRRLAKYCLQNLGLRKSTQKHPGPKHGLPPGHAFAEQLLSHLHRPRTRLGRGGLGLS